MLEIAEREGIRQTPGNRPSSEVSQLWALSLTACLLIAISGCLTALVAHFSLKPTASEVVNELIAETWRGYLVPEPVERLAYVCSLGLVVPIVISAVFWGERRPMTWMGDRSAAILCVLAGVLFSACLAFSDFGRLIVTGGDFREVPGPLVPLWVPTVLALAASCAVVHLSNRKGYKNPNRWITSTVNAAFCFLTVALLEVTRIRSSDLLYEDAHFEAVFYSISQVLVGKTILADLPAQYGLYAELLCPVIRLTGLSVLGFTAFLAALCAIGGGALVALCCMVVRDVPIRILAVATLLAMVGSTWFLIPKSNVEEYYQLWPIRFFFPALILLCIAVALRAGLQTGWIVTLGFLSGIAIIWNLDWGVPAFGSLSAYFLLRAVFCEPPERRKEFRRLALFLAIPLMIVGFFGIYLWVKSDGRVIWMDWFRYQSIFYATGFGMLPLPRTPHPWMAVIGIYIYGLVRGVRSHLRGKSDFSSDIMFVLSIFGIGAFTYYQGRSHDIVLTIVIWPAVLIAFMLADQTLRAVRLERLPPVIAWSTLPVLVCGFMCVYLLITGSPRLYDLASTTIASSFAKEATPRSINVDFVRAHTAGAREAVILDPGQSILFLETGLASAVDGPGIIEMLLVEDERHLIQQMLSRRIEHVFIRGDGSRDIPPAYAQLSGKYTVVDVSSNGLLYLKPTAVGG